MKRTYEKSSTVARARTAAYLSTMTVSAVAAVLAYAGLTVWIGVAAVVGSAVTSWSEFSSVPKKLTRCVATRRRAGVGVDSGGGVGAWS